MRCIHPRDVLCQKVRSRLYCRPARRWRRFACLVGVAVLAIGEPASGQTEKPEVHRYLKLGTTLPTIDATTSDYPGADDALTLERSRLTMPHVAVGWTAGPMMLEASYRKLGVLQFSRSDGALSGNTHSNGVQFAAIPITLRRPLFAVSPRVGVQAIRTIQTLDSRPPDWPYVGNVNTWRLLPAVGIDFTVALTDHWGLGMTYEPVFGRLGTAQNTGRYRQQFFGVDVVYLRTK